MSDSDFESEAGRAAPAKFPLDRRWSVGAAAELACVLEATAPKVGNVHPGASFVDMRYGHFLASAAAIGPVFSRSAELSVGALVLQSVRATREQVGLNTNLGTLLLFAPLAKAASGTSKATRLEPGWLSEAIGVVLSSLTLDDSRAVYEAIRVAKPGGLGRQAENDVHSDAPVDLIAAMRQASGVDAVARQYTNGFADVFNRLLPWFDEAVAQGMDVNESICEVQFRLLAEEPDGLIVRKCGVAVAGEVQSLAKRVVHEPHGAARAERVKQLDDFLRADGHRRNPGTSADMIAAMLFARLLVC